MEPKRLIKYPNRRLYSRDLHGYVTLEDVGRWWDEGHEIIIHHKRTRENLTVECLLEIIQQRVARKELEIKPEMIRRLVEV